MILMELLRTSEEDEKANKKLRDFTTSLTKLSVNLNIME